MVAEVVVDIAHPGASETYDYAVPDNAAVEQGSRVLIPFGRQKKQGFVLTLKQDTEVPAGKLRDIAKVLDPFPVLDHSAVDLARHLARTFHMPLAQAIRQLLPARLRQAESALKTVTYAQLAVDDEQYEAARASLLKKDGTVRYVPQMTVLETLRQMPQGLPLRDLPASTVKTLIRKNFVRLTEVIVGVEPAPPAAPFTGKIELVPQQQTAVDQILTSGARDFLLHGVTGSGKTEVYLRVIRHVLDKGQGAIILVPEIALTRQVHEYLSSRLGVTCALFHSRLTETERFEEWMRVRSGEARVVLGPRSAVFAPVADLGAIIIDEEQESSYKSGRYPAYTAKEVARYRAAQNDAFLILGSATPSVETYQEATNGEWRLVRMPERLFGAKLPPVEVVDMRGELQSGNPGIISGVLDDAVRRALDAGEQAMILLNRRGYSSSLQCPTCGSPVMCDQCDVSMTYHKSEGMLKCHYCGQRKPVPAQCPVCGSAHLRRIGIGTQRLEEELHRRYPAARILRMDADTMHGRGAHQDAYESFRAGEADILIGTQMIAKGFDFEKVTVAAVLEADSMLYVPDYRSAERAFDQITQLAGRAGRRGDGRVFVQTYSPDHYAVEYAAQHDFAGFFDKESEYRSGLHLPPYGEHIIVRFTSTSEERARLAAKDFLDRMRRALGGTGDNLIRARASESPIRRLQGSYRYQILMHLKERDREVEDEVYQLLQQASYDGVLVGVDINPNELY